MSTKLPVFTTTVGDGGQDALFLHSSLGSHKTLIKLAQALPQFRVTLMDLLGHGRSERVNGSTRLLDNAAAAAQIFAGPGLVFGHSFGAVTALRFAVDHPERVSRLILFEPVLFAAAKGTQAHSVNLARFAPMADAFDQRDHAKAAEIFMGIWGDGTPWTSIPELVKSSLSKRMFAVEDTRGDLEEDETGILSDGMLDAVTCPVLIVRGTKSPAVIADIQAALAARLPNAEIRALDGAGHMAPVQDPHRLATVITEWIEG